jgi:hypothetical protein
VTLAGPTADAWRLIYQGAGFTVQPAPLVVNAPSATAQYGNLPGSFTPTYTGLVNGQTAPSTPATCQSTATNSSPPGTYPITCSGAADPNYAISYGQAGTLTITKALTAIAAAPAKQGLLSTTFSATLTRADTGAGIAGRTVVFSVQGQSVCQAVTNSSGVASCTAFPSLVITLGPSTYTARFAGDADYQPSSASGQLTSGITVAGLTLGTAASGTHSATTLRATLVRSGIVYASGTSRMSHGVGWFDLRLRHRPVAGRYTLRLHLDHTRRTTSRTVTLR